MNSRNDRQTDRQTEGMEISRDIRISDREWSESERGMGEPACLSWPCCCRCFGLGILVLRQLCTLLLRRYLFILVHPSRSPPLPALSRSNRGLAVGLCGCRHARWRQPRGHPQAPRHPHPRPHRSSGRHQPWRGPHGWRHHPGCWGGQSRDHPHGTYHGHGGHGRPHEAPHHGRIRTAKRKRARHRRSWHCSRHHGRHHWHTVGLRTAATSTTTGCFVFVVVVFVVLWVGAECPGRGRLAHWRVVLGRL
mmetsp:Transcript_47989/g.120116  ORF Transcript_47989/g.120116 Transcript_47989/m.120116 type:complete len:249 (+) Transcript_47989:791-1537(+)